MNPITVGRNIAKYRKARNLTQAMLADLLGVSSKAVSKWECGRGLPDKSMLPSILSTLDITADQLVEVELSETEDSNGHIRAKKKRIITIAIALFFLAAVVLAIVIPIAVNSRNQYTLFLIGAEFHDGSTAAKLAQNAALENVRLDESKTFIGWADLSNRYYSTENFLMPASDMTLCAIYQENLGSIFTPSCLIEEAVTGTRKTLAHEYVGSIRATKFEFSDGVSANVGYKILNGLVTRPDSCDNSCRIYGDRGNILFLTLINNESADVDITYEIEYHKILGQESITVPANQTITLPINYSESASGNSSITCFHKIIFNKPISTKVSLTIYGQVYNPDFYLQENEYLVTFKGATYNGTSEFELLFNSRLSANAELILSDTSKTFAGWKTSKGLVYLGDKELLRDFRMTYGDIVITAVYIEDMYLFTPSCSYGDKSKRSEEIKLVGTHNEDGSTNYILDSAVPEWLIYNGPDEKHDVQGGCPVSVSEEYLYFMTLHNNTNSEVILEFGPEYYGLRDHTVITLLGHETVSVALRVYGFNTKTSFWQINNKSPADETLSDINLTIIGHYI